MGRGSGALVSSSNCRLIEPVGNLSRHNRIYLPRGVGRRRAR